MAILLSSSSGALISAATAHQFTMPMMKQQKTTKENKPKAGGNGLKTEGGGATGNSKAGLEIQFVVDKNPTGQSEYAPESELGLGWTDSGTSGKVVEDIDMITALKIAKEASDERMRNGVGPSRYLPPVDSTPSTTPSATPSTTPSSSGSGNTNTNANTIASFAGAFATPNLFINTPTPTPTPPTPTNQLLTTITGLPIYSTKIPPSPRPTGGTHWNP